MTVADKLPERLRAHVAGLTTPSAAVDLLVPHCTWLRRRGFLDEFTFSTADFDTGATTTGMEWAEAVAPGPRPSRPWTRKPSGAANPSTTEEHGPLV